MMRLCQTRHYQTLFGSNTKLVGIVIAFAFSVFFGTAIAQQPPVRTAIATDVQPVAKASNRWLLISCGLPGDDEHRDRLTTACEQLIAASESVLGVSADRLKVLAGDEEMQAALEGSASSIGICTKDSLQESTQSLCESVQPTDSCWVILLGHAHFYGNHSQYNILGSDIDQTMFAKMLKPLSCREQVVWVTTPVSGFWVKPLSQPNRVVIAATEPDLEFTGTEMPYALGDLLAGVGEETELTDVDQDGKTSLLDLYLATCLEIHGRFVSMERLQTEHSQLDDNADGRGSEIQEPYLPEPAPEEDEEEDGESDDESDSSDEASDEADEEAKPAPRPLPPPINNSNLDGFRSRHIFINLPKQ